MKFKNSIMEILRPFVPQFALNQWNKRREKKRYAAWVKEGYTVPAPHMVKQLAISDYQQRSGYTTFVETGTYLGDMVEAQKRIFKRVISIELDLELFKKAQKRFKNDKNVVIEQGDSGTVLPKILQDISEPAIFWLDGHYSGGITAKGDKDCPIFEELDAILDYKKFNHTLLVDDARCFVGQGDYPTIEQLIDYVRTKNEKYQVEVKNDIIRFTI